MKKKQKIQIIQNIPKGGGILEIVIDPSTIGGSN